MDVLEALQKRRSINFFETGKPLSDSQIGQLLETANLAPSSMNLQPWKVVVVRDPEKKKTLRKCAYDQPKVEEASAVLIMIADPGALEENIDYSLDSWVKLGYMKPEMKATYLGMAGNLYSTKDSLTRKIFAVKNTSLYAMAVMVAAQGMGLETHPMDGFDEACIKKEFGIPEETIIPMIIAVGYLRPGIALLPRAFRRELKDFVRYEQY
jgi:nitroreductase